MIRILPLLCLCVLLSRALGPESRGDGAVRSPHDPSHAAAAEAAGQEHRRGRMSGAKKALDWWAAQRAYPEASFPARGWSEAHRQAESMPRLPDAGKQFNDWRAIGPKNIAGRMLCVAFNPQNPNTVWAGSASGGVWRSYTGGVGVEAWERVDTGHPVLGVSSIAFAPGDSNVIYLGTGEAYGYGAEGMGVAQRITRGSYGLGILRSIDGGDHWSRSLDWSYDQRRAVQVVRVDPSDQAVVWAGTTEGVYKSEDGGSSWTRKHYTLMTTDLIIHAGNPDIVIAACGNLGSVGGGIYRTVDGGWSWNKILDPTSIPSLFGGKIQLASHVAEPDVMMASIGFSAGGNTATWLSRSLDGGATWSRRNTTDYSLWQGWFAHDVAIHPWDPDVALCVGIDIWRTEDSGATLTRMSDWQLMSYETTPVGGPEGPPDYSHADHHDVLWHPSDPDIVYFAGDGGVFRSTDGGLTFEGCNGGLQTAQFYAGFSTSRQDPLLAMGGLQDNSTVIYRGDDAWERDIGGDGAWTGINAVRDSIMLGSAQYLNMFRSTDRGVSWTAVSPAVPGNAAFVAPYVLAGPDHPEVAYAATTNVGKSTDSGASFGNGVSLNGDPVLTLAVSPQNADVVYAATAPLSLPAAVFRSMDGGASWDNVSAGLPDRYPMGLRVDPTDPETVYVAFGGFGTPHLFRSRDAGDHWEDLSLDLPDVPTLTIAVDPERPDHLYVGNDLGVFFSRDDGVHWYTLNNGLGDAVMAMDLAITPNGLLRVATHGNGAWERPLERETTTIDAAPSPSGPALLGNVPNPFNPSTVVHFRLPVDADVELEIFDLRGSRIRTLVREPREAGDHHVRWNGQNDGGQDVPAGLYVARLRSAGMVRTIKMQLVR